MNGVKSRKVELDRLLKSAQTTPKAYTPITLFWFVLRRYCRYHAKFMDDGVCRAGEAGPTRCYSRRCPALREHLRVTAYRMLTAQALGPYPSRKGPVKKPMVIKSYKQMVRVFGPVNKKKSRSRKRCPNCDGPLKRIYQGKNTSQYMCEPCHFIGTV